jgi:hypothetical protein
MEIGILDPILPVIGDYTLIIVAKNRLGMPLNILI